MWNQPLRVVAELVLLPLSLAAPHCCGCPCSKCQISFALATSSDAGKERDSSSENIYIAEAKLQGKNCDAGSVIKVTFTYIFLSKMMKINWLDHFKYTI